MQWQQNLLNIEKNISEEKTEGTQYNCQLIEINFQKFTKTFNENLNISDKFLISSKKTLLFGTYGHESPVFC